MDHSHRTNLMIMAIPKGGTSTFSPTGSNSEKIRRGSLIYWVVPPPSKSHHQDYETFLVEIPINLRFHYYWEGGQPNLYIMIRDYEKPIVVSLNVWADGSDSSPAISQQIRGFDFATGKRDLMRMENGLKKTSSPQKWWV